MAPSELINVREFRDKFAGLVRSQKDHGLFSAQSEWSEGAKAEVADRCRIDDDLCFSNAAFVNPTLFHMLRQHREFNEATERELLQKKREEAAKSGKTRQSNAVAQQELNSLGQDSIQNEFKETDDASEEGDGAFARAEVGGANDGVTIDNSMLLSVDAGRDGDELGPQAMDIDATTVEDALARLAGGSSAVEHAVDDESEQREEEREDIELVEKVYRVETPGGDDAKRGAQDSSHKRLDNGKGEKETDGSGTEKYVTKALGAAAETSNQESETDSDGSEMRESSADEDGDDETDRNSGDYTSENQVVSVSSAFKSRTRKPEEITLFTPVSELPKGITEEMLKQAIASSGFARSTDVEEETKRVVKQRTRVEEPAGVSELENKFRKVKDLLDESTLASLRKANRRMIPPKYRLEVNFMTNRVQPGPVPNATPVVDDEVLLSVCFYNTRSSTSKMEEYLVLGSQNLTVLRDAFYCISDFLFSHRDEQIENTKDKKVSSSYFFIEKTFYNDMRSPTATDYSRVIMEWANDPERQTNNPRLQGLQSRLMDGARFLDLSIRLRQPYLFVHQGDCEHVMMFTDLRLLGPKDDQFVENYPKQIFRTRHMRHKCRMCSAYPAQYVTKNDFHSGMSPCYFCEKCYSPFHFDNDGKKLLEHDVFPYANVNLM
ncbi:hypothetical protein H4217_005179 [Coemansia sp. RSA 1939]|nr:hypothetical protein H4217_005179 [Coemansia sp. RSA 1939]KAJ2614343.1 hypothetical protein EV177_002113 [Coemansia sp. RSA 1804]KAJ2682272.1 hypothetical protein GGH99_004812 [Coemansia sp. RSA 1285]